MALHIASNSLEMNTWFGSFFLAIFALTLGAAQDFDLDTDRLLMDGMAKRRVAELIGKRGRFLK